MTGDFRVPWTPFLPCPFCGSANVRMCEAFKDMVHVECLKCFACGPAARDREDGNRDRDRMRRQAGRAWNRRGQATGADWKLRRIAEILSSDHGDLAIAQDRVEP